jgi:hypothetical protein
MSRLLFLLLLIPGLTACPHLMWSLIWKEDGSPAKELYHGIQRFEVDRVVEALNNGADPNYCKGEAGWVESNPLGVLFWLNTSTFFGGAYKTADPSPDVAILNILVDRGADINRRPYIWSIVYEANSDDHFESIVRFRRLNNKSMDKDDITDEMLQFVSNVNRLLKAFLEAGADPDKRGHPYPFGLVDFNLRVFFLTDKKAQKYFDKGTRAINEAIKKGMLWESQVDLLLQYTKLDKGSLSAAELSHDPAMVDKINKLWKIQLAQE